MKKVFLCLMAVAALGFASCNKNYAEDYEGSYKTDIYQTVTITAFQISETDTTLAQDMNIVLVGDEGDVKIVFPYSDGTEEVFATGNVDKDGLHINANTMTETDEETGIVVSMTFNAADAKLDGNSLTWQHTTTCSMSMGSNQVPMEGSLKFNATKQE